LKKLNINMFFFLFLLKKKKLLILLGITIPIKNDRKGISLYQIKE